jgi:hypothetical protein
VQDQHRDAVGLPERGVVNAQFGKDIPGMESEVANHCDIMLRHRLRVGNSYQTRHRYSGNTALQGD